MDYTQALGACVRRLKVLLDRSLMLGSIDRPQLHDLVLDFVIGLHSEEELLSAQIRVVDAFRKNRSVSPAGIVGWSKGNRGDAATMYHLCCIIVTIRTLY